MRPHDAGQAARGDRPEADPGAEIDEASLAAFEAFAALQACIVATGDTLSRGFRRAARDEPSARIAPAFREAVELARMDDELRAVLRKCARGFIRLATTRDRLSEAPHGSNPIEGVAPGSTPTLPSIAECRELTQLLRNAQAAYLAQTSGK